MSTCNCSSIRKKCCPDCIVTVNECCLCEIDGCIVQDCDAGEEQYVFSNTNVDICINIKNDACREFDGTNCEFCNCDFTATLKNQANISIVGPVRIKPGQKKPLIGKQVNKLIITGDPSTGNPDFNGVRGSYNGAVRLV